MGFGISRFCLKNVFLASLVKVSVLIVTWNGLHLLEPCFAALRRQTYQPHEVIVVDNGSEDGSVDFLKSCDWPLLKRVFLKRNCGFSGGNNAGFPLVTGDLVALLNNDAEPEPEWIEQVVPLFKKDQIGMVACKALLREDPHRIDKVGHLVFPDGLNRGRGSGMPDDGRFDEGGEALWPDGGAGFYRKSMLDEIGFFDDAFFLYGEDAELGMRARWAGYGCLYQPSSRVLHRQSASLGKFSPLKAYYVERNRIFVLVKTFPLSWVLKSPFYSFLRYSMNLVSLVSQRGAAANFKASQSSSSLAGVLLKALWHGLLGCPAMWRKRQTVLRRIKSSEMIGLLKKYGISVKELTLRD